MGVYQVITRAGRHQPIGMPAKRARGIMARFIIRMPKGYDGPFHHQAARANKPSAPAPSGIHLRGDIS